MAERILVVDDDIRVSRVLKRVLRNSGYDVSTAGDGSELKSRMRRERLDLIVLDLNLPGEDGISLARDIRKASNIPIIMLTGRNDVIDKVVGLEIGADDYVTKPFDERELVARVRSVLRRRETGTPVPAATADIRARFAGWELDMVTHELISPAGAGVELTSHEFLCLAYMVSRPGHVLTRDQILEAVAGRDSYPTDRSIDVLIGKLRKKLGDDPRAPGIIRTIRGAGYKLAARVVSQ